MINKHRLILLLITHIFMKIEASELFPKSPTAPSIKNLQQEFKDIKKELKETILQATHSSIPMQKHQEIFLYMKHHLLPIYAETLNTLYPDPFQEKDTLFIYAQLYAYYLHHISIHLDQNADFLQHLSYKKLKEEINLPIKTFTFSNKPLYWPMVEDNICTIKKTYSELIQFFSDQKQRNEFKNRSFIKKLLTSIKNKAEYFLSHLTVINEDLNYFILRYNRCEYLNTYLKINSQIESLNNFFVEMELFSEKLNFTHERNEIKHHVQYLLNQSTNQEQEEKQATEKQQKKLIKIQNNVQAFIESRSQWIKSELEKDTPNFKYAKYLITSIAQQKKNIASSDDVEKTIKLLNEKFEKKQIEQKKRKYINPHPIEVAIKKRRAEQKIKAPLTF